MESIHPFRRFAESCLVEPFPVKAGAYAGSLRAHTLEVAERLSLRAVCGAFHRYRDTRGLPPDAAKDDGLRAFGNHLADPAAVQEILDGHPLLKELLHATTAGVSRTATECAARFEADVDDLTAHGLIDLGDKIVDMSFGQGDTHNHGRSVIVVGVTSGRRVVYKPRGSGLELLARRMLQLLEPHCDVDLADCIPPTLDCEQWSWHRFERSAPMTQPDQVERYWQRFGALLALCTALGGTDLHHENVLAVGERPVLVDGETLLQPDPCVTGPPLLEAVQQASTRLPTQTVLLPARGYTHRFDLLLCGLGIPWEQACHVESFGLVDGRSDACRIEPVPSFVLQHVANVPRLDMESLDPVNSFEDVMHGFRIAHTAVTRELPQLVELLADSDARIRIVLRPTHIYATFLEALTHPDYLREESERERILEKLRPTLAMSASAEFVGLAEREALRRRDVPLFTVGLHERDLHSTEGVGRAFLSRSPAEAAAERMRGFVDMPLSLHQYAIEASYAEIVRSADQVVSLAGRSRMSGLLDTEDPAAAYVRLLGELAVRCERSDGTAATWFTGLGDPGAPTLDLGTAQGFHDLGGVPSFLERVAARVPEAATLASEALRGWGQLSMALGTRFAGRPFSVFAGAPSSLFIDGSLQSVAVSTALERADLSGQDHDLILGMAGLALTLSNMPHGEHDDLLFRLWERLLAFDETQFGRPWHDLAHGAVGLEWARARAAKRLGQSSAQERTMARISEAWGTIPPDVPQGWCSGAAGLAVVRQDLMQDGFDPRGWTLDELLARAMQPASGPVDLSICHGASGVLRAAMLSPSSADARAYEKDVRTRIRRYGFTTGTPTHTNLLGHHLGWTGIIDTWDRYLHGAEASSFDAISLKPNSLEGQP